MNKIPFPKGIYGILGEQFSRGRGNVKTAELLVKGGIDILQYREKRHKKSYQSMYEECLEIRKITREAGVPFIVNDFLDLALAVGADGVHQGQDDLPIPVVKRLAPRLMVGCSTHSPEQAARALADGADYIGVGPIFPTQTKEDVCQAVGFSYLEQVASRGDVPFVAIGGIKRHNMKEVIARGATTICLVTEIIAADDVLERLKEVKDVYHDSL